MFIYRKLTLLTAFLVLFLGRSALADDMPLLVDLLPSIGTEHARWVLGHYQIRHKEQAHTPLFSNVAIKRHGGSHPYNILVTDGQVFNGHLSMFRHYEALASSDLKLLPADEQQRQAVKDWISFCNNELAGPSLLWAYYNILPERKLGLKALITGVPETERISYELAYHSLAKLLMHAVGANEKSAEHSLKRLRATFDKADALLKDGQSFFFADQLTIADTLFAAYAAPIVLAPEYGGSAALLPTLEQAPEKMRAVAEEFRARPAGQHVLRLYQQYRLGFE